MAPDTSKVSASTGKDVDGGWAWVVMLASFSSQLLVAGLPNLAGVFHVYLLEAFDETASKTALVGALFSGISCAAGPISSLVINATNCRCSAILGGLLTFIGFGACAFATSLDIMFITYGLLGGLGLSLSYIPSIVTLGYYFEKRRSIATGVAVTGGPLGMVIFPPIIHALVTTYGWRGSFAIIGALALNLCAFGLFFRPTRYERMGGKGLTMEIEDGHSDGGNQRTVDRRPIVITEYDCNDVDAKEDATRFEHECLLNEENSHRNKSIHVVTERHPDNGDHDDSNRRDCNCIDEKSNNNSTLNLHVNPHHDRTNIILTGMESHPLWADSATSRPDFSIKAEDRDDCIVIETTQSVYEKRGLCMQPCSEENNRNGRTAKRCADVYPTKQLVSNNPCCDDDRIHVVIEANTMSLENLSGKSSTFPFRPKLSAFMADFAILTNPAFLFLLFGVILFSIGKSTAFMYLPGLALKMGSNKEEGILLATAIGVGTMIVRVLAGVAANDGAGLDKGCLLVGSLSIQGFLCLVFRIFSHTFAGRFLFGVLVGFYYGVYPTLVNSITSEMVGVQNLSLAFGLLMLSMGVGTLIGPPIAVTIMESVGDYEAAFTFAGICFLLGCASCMTSLSWKKKLIEETMPRADTDMPPYDSGMEDEIEQSL